MTRLYRQLALLLVLVLVPGTIPGWAAVPPGRAGLRNKLHELWDRIRQKREQVEATADEKDRLSEQLKQSQLRLEHSEEQLRLAKEKVKAAQQEMDRNWKRLMAAHQRVRLHSRRLGRRIARNYTEGTVSYLEVLLGGATVTELLDRQVYVEHVLDLDRAVLRELRKAQEDVETERANLLRRRQQLLTAKHDINTQTQDLREQQVAHAKLLTEVQSQLRLQEQELDELEKDSAAITTKIAAEELRRMRLPFGSSIRRLRWSGKFARPCWGPTTSGFGYRMHPILGRMRMHTGIDFGVPMGAPVFAADAGEILIAGWCGGYGRCIIILHGDRISTLYGHLSVVHVKPRDYVERGQVIGLVGSTGFSTGPHLHFEVRKNGAPVNPAP